MSVEVVLKPRENRSECANRTLRRSRWDGPLNEEDRAFCVRNGIPLGYDPAQQGWVALDCPDAYDNAVVPGRDVAEQPPQDLELPPQRLRSIDLERRYTMRLWTEQDIPHYVALLDNPDIWAHLPEDYPDPLTPELAGDMIAMSAIGTRHDVRAIETGGQLIGQARLLLGAAGAEDAEISYWLGEPHWGKGYGTDIVTLFSYQSFRSHPALKSIFARIHKDNVASQRVVEKSNYANEGADPKDADWLIFRVRRSEFWLN